MFSVIRRSDSLFSVVVSYFCGSLLFVVMIALLKSNYRLFISFFFTSNNDSRRIVCVFISLIWFAAPQRFSEIFAPFVSHSFNAIWCVCIFNLIACVSQHVFVLHSMLYFLQRFSIRSNGALGRPCDYHCGINRLPFSLSTQIINRSIAVAVKPKHSILQTYVG